MDILTHAYRVLYTARNHFYLEQVEFVCLNWRTCHFFVIGEWVANDNDIQLAGDMIDVANPVLRIYSPI
jgi:hypothetical protein